MIKIDRNTRKQLFYLFTLSLILGVLTLLFHPRSAAVSWQRPGSNSAADSILAAVSQQNITLQEPLAINTRQARALQHQNAIVVDARLPEDFRDEHIVGAVNIPFERKMDYQTTIDSLSNDDWVVTYCWNPSCDLAGLLAWELFYRGFAKVAVYHPGIEGWKEAGYETEGGANK
jgi:rhodanese-related sulfurtransferase